MRLSEKLYWYPWQGRANNCNSYLYAGSVKVLFDPGHLSSDFNEDCLGMLKRQLSADGFDPARIDLILCTHGHPDHVEAVGSLRSESGARSALHQGDEFILEAIARHMGAPGGGDPGLQPDFFLEEGLLDLGPGASADERIEVIHTPGHSPGSVCFFLPEQKALISGDTVFEGSIGRADLPGGSMATLGSSIEKLAALENLELLLPGHMGCISGAEAVQDNFTRIRHYFFS